MTRRSRTCFVEVGNSALALLTAFSALQTEGHAQTAPRVSARLPAPVMVNGKPCVALPQSKIAFTSISLMGIMILVPPGVDDVDAANGKRIEQAAVIGPTWQPPGPTGQPSAALLDSTFARMRQIGYQVIEGGGGGATAQLLAKHGIKVATAGGGRSGGIDEAIANAKAAGVTLIGGGGYGAGDYKSVEGIRTKAVGLNEAGKKAYEAGMKIFIHNHEEEFDLVDYDLHKTGKLEKVPAYEVLMDLTDPRYVYLQIDIRWIMAAYLKEGRGGQAAALDFVRRHADRVILFHVKDTDPNGWNGQGPVGKGITDWPAWWAAAPNVEYYAWEADTPPDPLEYAKAAYNLMACKP
jgi:sugar phosphate isomerase/epimerase